MLRQCGGCNIVIAAPNGLKMELAKRLDAADQYVELSRTDPEAQLAKLNTDNPHGFDIVIEATGCAEILENSINYVRRGGKLVVYGVYSSKDRVSWPPSKICKFSFHNLFGSETNVYFLVGDEITIVGSFSQLHKFPAAIDYLDSGKIKVDGIVNKTFKIDQWEECLKAMRNKTAIKAAIVFD